MPTFRSTRAVCQPVRPLVLVSGADGSRSVTTSLMPGKRPWPAPYSGTMGRHSRVGILGRFGMVRHAPVTKGPAKSPAIKVAVAVMLTVAVAGALWVPIYAHLLPKLGDFPFFYWYQLILVPVTAIL